MISLSPFFFLRIYWFFFLLSNNIKYFPAEISVKIQSYIRLSSSISIQNEACFVFKVFSCPFSFFFLFVYAFQSPRTLNYAIFIDWVLTVPNRVLLADSLFLECFFFFLLFYGKNKIKSWASFQIEQLVVSTFLDWYRNKILCN